MPRHRPPELLQLGRPSDRSWGGNAVRADQRLTPERVFGALGDEKATADEQQQAKKTKQSCHR